MDMKTYLKQATPEQRECTAVEAETSVGYLYLIGGGHKKPGTALCQRLVKAEPKLTLPELRPDVWPPSSTAPADPAVTPVNPTGETA